jgi:hypothetical protein
LEKNVPVQNRYLLALLALLMALLSLWLLSRFVLDPAAQTIAIQLGNTHVNFSADRTRLLLPSDCILIEWNVNNAEKVEFTGGISDRLQGKRSFCGTSPAFTVYLTEEVTWSSRFTRDFLLIQPAVWLLVGFTVIFLSAALRWLFPNKSTSLIHYLQQPSGLLVSPMRAARRFIQTESKLHLLILITLIISGIILRLHYLSQPLRLDEARNYHVLVSNQLFNIITDYSVPNNHILMTLLTQISTVLFGSSPSAIRLPAFLAGISIVPLTYWIGRVYYNREAGLVACALAAVAMPLVFYSTNARGYSLQILFLLVSLLLIVRLHQRPHWRLWLGYILTGALSFYTLPTAIYPIAICASWLLFHALLERNWQLVRNTTFATLLTIGLGITLYLPVILFGTGLTSITSNQFVASQEFNGFLTALPRMIAMVWANWHTDLPAFTHWLTLGSAAAALIFHKYVSSGHKIPLLLIAVIITLGLVLLQQVTGTTRVWLFLLPIFLVTTAAGLTFPLRKTTWAWIVEPISILLVLVLGFALLQGNSVYTSNETGAFRSAEEVALRLKSDMQPHTELANYDDFYTFPLRYYMKNYNIPKSMVGSEPADQLFIVAVRHNDFPSLEEIVATRVDLAHYGPPILVQTFEDADLYVLERRSDTLDITE